MSKKSRFRGPFDKWHGKRAETLFKASRQHLYHIYLSLWKQCRFKKSLWVICKILGLLVNAFTAHNLYSLLNRGNLLQHYQMQLSQKRKIFSDFLFPFSKFTFTFEHFQRKGDPHTFWVYRLWNTSLNKCLNSPVTEDPSTSNMVVEQKHCSNLNHTTFTKFIDLYEDN